SVNASNVLNHFNEGRINGTLTSPFFGKSNSTGGGGGGFGFFGGSGGGKNELYFRVYFLTKNKRFGTASTGQSLNKFCGVVFSTIVIIGGVTLASAQDVPVPPPPGGFGGGQRMMQFQMPTFADLDKNKDKKISKDEFPSQFPPQLFDRIDTNHDGSI